ncbi:hypothetical protein ACSFA0_19590 [Variovorax sp. LT1P1]|uniref:hypothetical protein n=1 Tax=Variovorax sp. LT1P1 TaxID=3443730 RepID=UPI003F48B066
MSVAVKLTFAVLAVLASASVSAAPMRFEVFRPCGGNGAVCAPQVLAQGDIELDTAQRLAAFLRTPAFKETGMSAPFVAFDSAGGNLAGGVILGKYLRSIGADTFLAPTYSRVMNSFEVESAFVRGAKCASACTMAFIGGQTRSVAEGSMFGVHQFVAEQRAIGDGATQEVVVALAGHVEAMGVDRGLLDRASMVPPSHIQWLPVPTLVQLNVDNRAPRLSPWTISAAANGNPLVTARQPVAFGRMTVVVLSAGGPRINVAVAALFAPDVAASARDRFPVGDEAEISFNVDGRSIRVAPAGAWERMHRSGTSAAYVAKGTISREDLARISSARKLGLEDGFPNALRDVWVSTPISTDQLAPAAALLLRSP